MPFLPATSKRVQARLRPLLSTTLIVSILVVISYFNSNDSPIRAPDASLLVARGETKTCRDVYYAEDRCSFVKSNCEDEQSGIIPYLTIYYCDFYYNRFAGFALLTLWLGLLFSTIGIAASDFFSPNLQTIANVLNMPENLAGVTFLAIGNGSPDVFSTVMAMRSNSAAMAVGELIGAASFITAIVAGTIGCVTEFKVGRSSFVRDLSFFIAAVCFTMGFLIDGHLYPFECVFMIGYYVFYVVVVGGSHWFQARRARRRQTRADAEAARLSGSSGQIDFEPYRDRVEESTAHAPSTRTSATIQAGANGTPRISVDGPMDFEEAEDLRRRHRAAQIAGNMRVRRPTYGRKNSHAFIRPSLVGALEFKSAIDNFRREEALGGSVSSYSHGRSHSVHNLPRAARGPESQTHYRDGPSGPIISVAATSPTGRERAVSYGAYAAPAARELTVYAEEGSSVRGEASASSYPFPELVPETRIRTPSPGGPLTVPGTTSEPATRQNSGASGSSNRSHTTGPLRLQIPSRRSSASGRSETLSPFPGYTDSPQPMTPNSEIGVPHLELSAPAPEIPSYSPALEAEPDEMPPRWRWWPYSILPGPEDMASTLFPTVQGWNDKGFVDMVLSTMSVPSVFLLSVTLPVVEPRGDDGCSTSEADGELATFAQRDDSEWDRFRRRTRSGTILSSSTSLAALDRPEEVRPIVQGILPKAVRSPSQPVSPPHNGGGQLSSNEDSWNRWQVLVQIAVGPTFATFIIAFVLLEQNMTIVKWSLIYTALISLACFVFILMATTAGRRPKYYNLLCFPGFLVSVAWIVAIAGEVVGVLKAMGVILAISEAILGLTIFAAGNSVGDWVSNYTIARLGSPVMAL